MVVEPDGSLTVHLKDQQPEKRLTLVFVALILSMVLAVIASAAFSLALLEVRASRQSAEARDRQATIREQNAAEERAELALELRQIRGEAARALGEQECRSLAFARQNAIEADADVVTLELLTETVAQTFRAARGQPLQFNKLDRLERFARAAVRAEADANDRYRAALENCES